MSAILDMFLDAARRSDCCRNDEAMRLGSPLVADHFPRVEVAPKPAQEEALEGCDE